MTNAAPRPHLAEQGTLFLRIFLGLTLIAFVTVVQANYFLDNSTGSLSDLAKFFVSRTVYYWYFLGLAVVVEYLSRRVPFIRSAIGRWSVTHLAILAVSFVVHQMLSLGVDRLVWGTVRKGSYLYLLFNNPSIWIEVLGYGALLLLFSLRELRRANEEKELRCSELEAQIAEARYEELRTRLHPTFLFNTLDNMAALIRREEHRAANTLLGLFSDFLRTTVYDRDLEERTLQDELTFLNQFLAIENMRTQNALSINEHVAEEMLPTPMPSFVLQPLVEELLQAMPDPVNSPGEIQISVMSPPPTITMAVTRRGCANESAPLFNAIRDRLERLYGGHYHMQTSRDDDRLGVTLSFPLAACERAEARPEHTEESHP
jgi:hypothetical protein